MSAGGAEGAPHPGPIFGEGRAPAVTEITQYGPRASGARSCSVTLDGGFRVLVEPNDEAQNAAAMDLARRIAGDESRLAGAKSEAATLREQVERLEAKVRDLRAVNEAATTGRRRFFGPVLLKAGTEGWAGPVWLLDPEKQERGTGLLFASLAEARSMHPELWVIGTTADGVLLDAWGEVAP